MNDGIEAFRLQLQKELGLSIGPKDPLLALWVSQKELLEQNAAQQQKLLSEFQAALGRNQTAWSKRWRPAGGSPGRVWRPRPWPSSRRPAQSSCTLFTDLKHTCYS